MKTVVVTGFGSSMLTAYREHDLRIKTDAFGRKYVACDRCGAFFVKPDGKNNNQGQEGADRSGERDSQEDKAEMVR